MAANTDQDHGAPSRSPWGSDFWDHRRKLSRLIAGRPTGYHPSQLVPAPQATQKIKQTEKLLTHVVGLLSPKRDLAGDKWERDVATLTYEKDSEQTTETLSLADIASWTEKQTTVTREKPGRAAGNEEIPVRGYLPPTAAANLFLQLEEVLDHLGWTDDEVIQDYRAGENEVAHHS